MEKINKLIVSHRGNIVAKYGSNAKKIFTLLEKFRKAAKQHGMTAGMFYLDDESLQKDHKITPVSISSDPEQFKSSIDALYKKFDPDYIVLIGAQDIIPFQPLKNSARRHDDENEVPSDLPYASDHPFSIESKDFVSPSRVVGRIPDIPDSGDVSYLTNIINTAINWEPKDIKFYKSYFAVSTVSWQRSTQMNIARMFGNFDSLLYSPISGPDYKKNHTKPSIHFYNCHGALEEPTFYGEKGKKMPEAIHANSLAKKITPGSIAAAECCYGAQLFSPEEVGSTSIANTYLAEGAIAFMGSTNIAYGPSDNLALADLITQYFLVKIFEGASTGRALLEARIQFLQEAGPYLDVIELKTVAQFILLGDPSIHPVKSQQNTVSATDTGAWKNSRSNRRENLKLKGQSLDKMIVPPVHTQNNELPLVVQKQVKKMLQDNNMTGEIRKEVYVSTNRPIGANGKSTVNEVKYIAYSTKEDVGKIARRKILMVKEKGDNILGSRIYVSK
jgi:hypothetical protein